MSLSKILILAGLALSSTVQAQAVVPAASTSGTMVIVPATGEVTHANDEATIIFAVEEHDKDKNAAAARVNQKMKQGVDIVRSADPSAELKTQGYYTYPVYPELPPRPESSAPVRPIPAAWRVGQYLQVKTRNLAGLPKTAAAAQKVLSINNLTFGLTRETARLLDDRRIAETYRNLNERIASIARSMGRNPADPLEPFNRGVYQFNDALDKAIVKPVAQAYRAVIPQFIRSSVSNFFSNINDIVVGLNNLLQGKFTAAYSDLGRVAMNSTLGVLGLFDIATEAGMERHEEDFGQTLGYWGVGDGPFLVLPLFGPSNIRDGVGRFVDSRTDVVTYIDPSRARNQLWLTRGVNRRAELLDASTVLQTAALDPYEFVRDAYLQRRRNLIYDGAPPADREFMDPAPAPSPKTSISPFPTAAYENGPLPVNGNWRSTPVVGAIDSPLPIRTSRAP